MNQIKFNINFEHRYDIYSSSITVYTNNFQIMNTLKNKFGFDYTVIVNGVYSSCISLGSNVDWNDLLETTHYFVINCVAYLRENYKPMSFSETYEV